MDNSIKVDQINALINKWIRMNKWGEIFLSFQNGHITNVKIAETVRGERLESIIQEKSIPSG